MFCIVSGAERKGLAKILQVQGTQCVVEYFDSPIDEVRHQVSVPLSSIRRKRLGQNVRVFVLDEILNQWMIGRVRDDDGEGVEVRLAHKRDVYLPYESVFVRWKQPIQDPVEFLGNFITETPQYAEARSGFMQNYIYQRGVTCGISALLSSAIELETHQIDVVRRILTDHTQRYLLADEVGLGKTIEAGVVIRQIVLDDMREHKILILVPRELVSQWREELTVRFGLSDFLDETIFILPQEYSPKLREVALNLSLLVIDEAHHLAAANASESVLEFYKLVSEISKRTDKLLLLSATPVLRNESGFLRMLHLLDPVVYPLDDLDKFREKVSNRQTLAETVAALDPSNSLFMDSVLDELLARIPNDPCMRELSLAIKERLLDMPDEFDLEFCTLVRELRAHISETYRLNRRILRNRRTQVKGLTPDRKGAQLWRVDSSPMERIELALENWRIAASLIQFDKGSMEIIELANFYWNLVCALSGDPAGFALLCIERQKEIENGCLIPFEGEEALLNSILQSVDTDTWMERRLERLYTGLVDFPEGLKAVIFCANAGNADLIHSYLVMRKLKVVRHGRREDLQEFESDSCQVFMRTPDIRAIVCDQSAEEGVNLQGGNKAIIHFDLPLQPNRIEQRIGRADRYGAGSSVPSVILIDANAPLQISWFKTLDEGLGVFDRSISSLQYLVEEKLATISHTLIYEGAEGFDSLYQQLAGSTGEVAREIRLIDQQDALDQLSPLPEQELDDLFDADADWKSFGEAMSYWIEKTLLFAKVRISPPSIYRSLDAPFRFHYCPPDSESGRPTLIPLSEFIDEFLGVIDFDAPANRASRPLSYPYVTHRSSAVKHRVRPLRYGNEFVEAIRSFSELDVRGRSYAMWRQFQDTFLPMEIRTCFRFDFLIETCVDEALEVLVHARNHMNESVRSSLSRRGDALFRPTVIQVWLDEEGEELSAEFIKMYLAPEYAKEGGYGYVDKNLDASYLRALRRWMPDRLTNWNDCCQRMRDKAIAIVKSKPELLTQQKESLERASVVDEISYAQLRARIQSLDGREAIAEQGQLELERSINEALQRGISSPSLRVDVAGVVFLTSEPVSLLDGY